MDIILLELDVQAYHHNHWPWLRIQHGNIVLFDREVIDLEHIELAIPRTEPCEITFTHYNKQSNDTSQDGSQDCKMQILDIKFDKVSIGPNLLAKLPFITKWTDQQLIDHDKNFLESYSHIAASGGWLTFNGTITLKYQLPIYDWLIIQKYKVNEDNERAYYSNYTARWNYDKDLEILDEIRTTMGFDENCNSRYTKT